MKRFAFLAVFAAACGGRVTREDIGTRRHVDTRPPALDQGARDAAKPDAGPAFDAGAGGARDAGEGGAGGEIICSPLPDGGAAGADSYDIGTEPRVIAPSVEAVMDDMRACIVAAYEPLGCSETSFRHWRAEASGKLQIEAEYGCRFPPLQLHFTGSMQDGGGQGLLSFDYTGEPACRPESWDFYNPPTTKAMHCVGAAGRTLQRSGL